MTQHVESYAPPQKKRALPIIGKARVPADDSQLVDVDLELKKFEDEERQRLGLEAEERWLEKMANLGFTKSEKEHITLLIGGLTVAQDYLVKGAFSHLGYNVVALDCPDYDALRVGKEFGNRGQCNPTYFTVGNLVKYLIYLREKKGLTSEEVVKNYVFLTAGACGPCRFGMYVTEYRKALRDAGFDGFRVMLFQQQGGLSQATGEASGLDMSPKFFIGMLKGLLAGDVINGVGYRIRPYEVEPGATDAAFEKAKQTCHDALAQGKSILWALKKSRDYFAAVKVDRSIPRPKVAIIGEFWAMTTEGDGNYQLQRFIESQGGEADIQFVTAWLLYNVWEVSFDTKNRAGLRAADKGTQSLKDAGEYGVFKRRLGLWAADKAIRVAFHTFARAGGFYGYVLPNMDDVAAVAAPYYNNDLRGGEGHMEVGKLILNVAKSKATMTLSVKPFGCMPSSGVSDGVQSLITEKFPGTIFCPVETSGDGAVNFQSRVQMYLFKARQAAAEEFEKALTETGLTLASFRDFLAAHPRFAGPLHHPPHQAAGTSADLVYEVGNYVNKTALQRGSARVSKLAANLGQSTVRAWKQGPEAARVLGAATLELADIAKEKSLAWIRRPQTTLPEAAE